MTLPQRTLSDTPTEHLADHNLMHPGYQYTIRQSQAGGAIAARPDTADIPDGAVTWLLFDEPGTQDGPDDVEDLDLVINISGTPW